jgi:signal transduction histidine kinase
VGQLLTALRLEMGWLEKRVGPDSPEQRAWLRQTVALIERSTAELRRICQGLRPPLLDELGLGPAVRYLVGEFTQRSALPVAVRADPDARLSRLPHDQVLCLYRVLQEALSNVARHARARRAEVSLRVTAAAVVLEVIDDGVGFDARHPARGRGCGLLGMRERAALVGGTLRIDSAEGRGTRIRLRLGRGRRALPSLQRRAAKEREHDSCLGG